MTSFTPEKTNDEVLSLFRRCFVSRSKKKITIKSDYLIRVNFKITPNPVTMNQAKYCRERYLTFVRRSTPLVCCLDYLMWQIHVEFFKTLELVKQVSHLTINFKPRELSHSQQRISITETRKINIICTL